MVEPLVSGRRWEPVPPQAQSFIGTGRSELLTLRDMEDHSHLVLFKRPPPQAPASEIYSLALERIAYELGTALGIPVPPAHLEDFEGAPGVMCHLVENSVNWSQFRQKRLSHAGLTNQDETPLFVAFDIWLANYDRTERNVLLQAEPPGTAIANGVPYSIWLIDHGFTALWPPGKFGREESEPPAMASIGDGTTAREGLIRERMPPGYWQLFQTMPAPEREQVITRVRTITDVQIEEAVSLIPAVYMSSRERDLTVDLLQRRLLNLDTLVASLLS